MRSQQLRLLYLVSVIALACVGCEKVIHLKTDNLAKKYVIEANMSDQFNDCRVIATTTVNLNEPTIFQGVSDARISIQEDDKPPVVLSETGVGLYENNLLRARSGHRYTLDVEIGGQRFSSQVTVPEKVPLDTLYIVDFDAFGSVRKFANIEFQDPPGIPNSYRFLQFKNGVQNSNIFVMNDDFSDGRLINTFLTFFDDSDVQKINTGDTVTVEMQGVDPSVYLYFNSLSQGSTGGAEIAAPGNPVSNISGGALGYFNAYIKQQRTVIVP